MKNEHTGVEDVPAAGEQEIDFASYLDDEETGVEQDAGAADQEQPEQEPQEPQEQGFGDEKVEVAFAKRLEAEREKMRREYEAQYQQQPPQAPPQPAPGQQGYQQYAEDQMMGQDLTRKTPEQLRELADEWMVGTEVVRAMQQQQMIIARQQQESQYQKQMLAKMYDNDQKLSAKSAIEAQRAQNPYLPEFNENQLNQIREKVANQTGYVMSYEEAYDRMVAESVRSGNFTQQLTRNAQQQTIRNVAARDRSSLQAGTGQQANKPSIEDMSDRDFEKMIEAAKQGKLAR